MTSLLDEHFSKSLPELPSDLRRIASRVIHWDNLDENQRRYVVKQLDYQNDPANEQAITRVFDLVVRKDELEMEIRKWSLTGTQSAIDLALQERKLSKLGEELKKVEAELQVGEMQQEPKPLGHLNHDIELQRLANELAAELLKTHPKAAVTKQRVATRLAKQLDRGESTVERRIRKEW